MNIFQALIFELNFVNPLNPLGSFPQGEQLRNAITAVIITLII